MCSGESGPPRRLRSPAPAEPAAHRRILRPQLSKMRPHPVAEARPAVVAELDLPCTGDPRARTEPAHRGLVVVPDLLGQGGPGADEAHLALNDVPQLRELVEARHPQEAPDARRARV